MKEKRFKVFATDGKNIWEIFFITQSSNGDFYLGDMTTGLGGKWSRHVSGKMHYKAEKPDTYQNLGKRQKLTEFEGIEQLLCFTITKHAFKRQTPGKLYKGKKFDGSAFIDVRNYDKLINIMPFLLEPDQTRILANLTKGFLKNPQIIIFTQTKPWIVLTVHEP